MDNVLSSASSYPFPSFHWQISQGFGDCRCKFCEGAFPHPVQSPAPPLQPCSSTPHPHPRSGGSREQAVSTFPGAVRASLLGDRDNTGERLAQLRLGLTAGPERGGSGRGESPTHTDSSTGPFISRAPLLCPLEGWENWPHPGRWEAAFTATHSPRSRTAGLEEGIHMLTFTQTDPTCIPCEPSLLGSTNTSTVMFIYGQMFVCFFIP